MTKETKNPTKLHSKKELSAAINSNTDAIDSNTDAIDKLAAESDAAKSDREEQTLLLHFLNSNTEEMLENQATKEQVAKGFEDNAKSHGVTHDMLQGIAEGVKIAAADNQALVDERDAAEKEKEEALESQRKAVEQAEAERKRSEQAVQAEKDAKLKLTRTAKKKKEEKQRRQQAEKDVARYKALAKKGGTYQSPDVEDRKSRGISMPSFNKFRGGNNGGN